MSGFDVSFFVTGIPSPQGSKRHVGNGVMVEQSGQKLKSWREAIRNDCAAALVGISLSNGPISVYLVFHMPRPRNHYVSSDPKKGLKKTAPFPHSKRPDLDKLVRSTLDGLKSGGAYTDDSQVAYIHAQKVYAEGTVGVRVRIMGFGIYGE